LWSIEERIAVPVSPGKRSIIPVRLKIPRAQRQIPTEISSILGVDVSSIGFEQPIVWMLEVTKEVKGIEFYASFEVPVYDLEAEQ